LDPSGNVLVTGTSSSMLTFLDYLTVKFDPNGNQLWAARYSGMGGFGQDITSAIKVDGEGNAYVTGYSAFVNTNSIAFATVKYDANGNQLWAARYETAEGGNFAADLALGPGADLYVTG